MPVLLQVVIDHLNLFPIHGLDTGTAEKIAAATGGNISMNPFPQQRNGYSVAVIRVHASPTKLQFFPRKFFDVLHVKLGGSVPLGGMLGGLQTVGADYLADAFIDDDKVITVLIKLISIQTGAFSPFQQFLEKDIVPQAQGFSQLFRGIRRFNDKVILFNMYRDVGRKVLHPALSPYV